MTSEGFWGRELFKSIKNEIANVQMQLEHVDSAKKMGKSMKECIKFAPIPENEVEMIQPETNLDPIENELEQAVLLRNHLEKTLAYEMSARDMTENRLKKQLEDYVRQIDKFRQGKKILEEEMDKIREESLMKENKVSEKVQINTNEDKGPVVSINRRQVSGNPDRLTDIYEAQMQLTETVNQLENCVRKREVLLHSIDKLEDDSVISECIQSEDSAGVFEREQTNEGVKGSELQVHFKENDETSAPENSAELSTMSIEFQKFREELAKTMASESDDEPLICEPLTDIAPQPKASQVERVLTSDRKSALNVIDLWAQLQTSQSQNMEHRRISTMQQQLQEERRSLLEITNT